MKYAYRVVWERKGCRRKYRSFETLKAAHRFVTLLGPEPWKAHGRTPDESVREVYMERRKDMPELLSVRLERRAVSPWERVVEEAEVEK